MCAMSTKEIITYERRENQDIHSCRYNILVAYSSIYVQPRANTAVIHMDFPRNCASLNERSDIH